MKLLILWLAFNALAFVAMWLRSRTRGRLSHQLTSNSKALKLRRVGADNQSHIGGQ